MPSVDKNQMLQEDGTIKPITVDRQNGKFSFLTKDERQFEIGLPSVHNLATIVELKILAPANADEQTYRVF